LQALEAAEANTVGDGPPFDVLISDIGLPDGSGLDLLALLAAAVLPGTGRDPLLRIDKQPDAAGLYPLLVPGLQGEELAGHLHLFDEALVDALNVAAHLLQSPESLAWLLEAAGAVALERCGAILAERSVAAG
jgi:CheY-like chemotaxis protein